MDVIKTGDEKGSDPPTKKAKGGGKSQQTCSKAMAESLYLEAVKTVIISLQILLVVLQQRESPRDFRCLRRSLIGKRFWRHIDEKKVVEASQVWVRSHLKDIPRNFHEDQCIGTCVDEVGVTLTKDCRFD